MNHSIIDSSCLKSRFYSSKRDNQGSKSDKDGTAFEKILTSILKYGGCRPGTAADITKQQNAKLANDLYSALGITKADIKSVSCNSADLVVNNGPKSRTKTDILITLHNGEHISLSLKNTKKEAVGVLETSLDAMFKNFSIDNVDVQSAFQLFKNKYKYRTTEFKKKSPEEYMCISNFFKTNIKSFLTGLICGHNSAEIKKPDFMVINDKVLNKMLVVKVEDYINMVLYFFPRRHTKTSFGAPLKITRASGGEKKDLIIKFKIYNPLRDINKLSDM